jgi:hypothetical protein
VGALIGVCAALGGVAAAQQPLTKAGAACGATSLPATRDNATEPKSGRTFILQFPCDLRPNEPITLILNIHGAGANSAYQHQYFPAGQYAQKYRLVVATPTAATATPIRTWQAQADDQYLHDLTDLLISEFGKSNIKSFWLAGHSQGGATSARIVCSPYFRSKVDGFLSLSGGRQGGGQTGRNPQYNYTAPGVPPVETSGAAPARGGAAPARGGAAPAGGGAAGRGAVPGGAQASTDGPTTCDYSHIYDSGQWEIAQMPETSTIAEKFGCTRRVARPDVVDTEPGYTYDPRPPVRIGWGRAPKGGAAHMWVWEGCRDGRVVADVLRMDKGHTEGLEPKITEEIIKLMVSARGGRLQQS